MKTLLAVLTITIVAVCLLIPKTNNGDILERNGILGNHAVGSIQKIPGFQGSVEGSVSGSFLLIAGQIKGGIRSENHIEFSWCPRRGEAVVTDVPIALIRVIISSAETPEVHFVFDESWLKSQADPKYQKIENVNSLIDSSKLKEIEVYISEADLEKEPALPQLSKAAKVALAEKKAREKEQILKNKEQTLKNEEELKKQKVWLNEPVTIDVKYFVKIDSVTYAGSTQLTFPRWQGALYDLPNMVVTEETQGKLREFWTSIKLEGKPEYDLLIPTDAAKYPEFHKTAKVICSDKSDWILDGLLVERCGNYFTVFAAPTKSELEEIIKAQKGI